MPTQEEVKRAHDYIVATEQGWGTQAGIVGMQAQQYQGQAPSCAHLIVGYVRQALGSGRERGWWQCTECDAKFLPAGTVPARTPGVGNEI